MVIPDYIQFRAKFPFLTKSFYNELVYFLMPEVVDPFNLKGRKVALPDDEWTPFCGKLISENITPNYVPKSKVISKTRKYVPSSLDDIDVPFRCGPKVS